MPAAIDLAQRIVAHGPRGAGSDAERRTALDLAREVQASGRRAAEIDTFWCRPNWALAQAWHVALGLAGTLLAVSDARIGGGLVLAGLIFVLSDVLFAVSPGRRLTPERASQNVVCPPRATRGRVRLIVTANLDAGRAGLAYRPWLRAPLLALRHRLFDGRAPGWAAWLTVTLVWALVVSLLRLEGHHDTAVAALQLVPSVVLVIALALLLELAGAEVAPGAGDNASGVALAVALTRALDAAPPANLDVELVITGAGDGQGLGLRHHLRSRRRERREDRRDSHEHRDPAAHPGDTAVLGLGPCGAGAPRWLVSDGPLVPLAYSGRLRQLAAEVATLDPGLGLAPARGRGASPALPARASGLPALTLTCLTDDGMVPHSHLPSDTAENVDPGAADSLLRAALLLVDALDAHVGSLRRA